MGLDATIRRADRKPLGACDAIEKAISTAFPGARFVLEHLGHASKPQMAEFLKRALPGVTWKFSHTKSQEYVGTYEGEGFSAQFMFPAEPKVREVYVALYGDTERANPRFAILRDLTGWEVEYS